MPTPSSCAVPSLYSEREREREIRFHLNFFIWRLAAIEMAPALEGMAVDEASSEPKDDGAIIQSIGIPGYHIVNDITRPKHTMFSLQLRSALGR